MVAVWLKPCPHWRLQSPNSAATICRRSRRRSRQCGQGFSGNVVERSLGTSTKLFYVDEPDYYWRWVAIRGYTVLVFNQATPGQLSLVIPPWTGEMSTSDGYGYR